MASTSPEPELETRFGALLGALSDFVWMISSDMQRVLYVNDAVRQVYGREPDEFRTDKWLWLKVVHPDDRSIAEESMRRVDRTGAATVTYRIVRPDGEIRWLNDHKIRFGSGADGESFFGGITRDITERKQAEELAQMQQVVLSAVAGREEQTEILAKLCRAIAAMVPQSVATVLLLDDERRLRVAAAPGCPPGLVEALDGLVPGPNVGSCGTAAYTGLPCIVADTTTDDRWDSSRATAVEFGIVSCWSIPISLPEQGVIGTFAISSFVQRSPDCFHQRLLQAATQLAAVAVQNDRYRAELGAAVASAEAAARTKSALLANVSHELRTPMTAILGFSELLMADPTVSDRQRDDLRLIKSNGDHLLKIINDLLDVSKIEAGGLELELRACSPRELLADTVKLFEGTIRQKQLVLRVVDADSLPDGVLTDPTRLRQILVNLVSNAVKFTEMGEIAITCSATDLDGDRVRLAVAVSDTGIGLTEEQLGRIFAPFSQADASTTRRYGGTGLGLSVSKQLAGMLDGEITVRSEPGRGSTFTLTLVATKLGAEQAAAVGRPPEVEAPVRTPGLRILLAEDTQTIQKLLAAVLRQAGAEVVIVGDGATACRAVAEAERLFDAVIMDMQMPAMDGYEATRALRRDGYEGPIVALTARAQAGDREECLEAGCDAYMAKPLDPSDLVRLVAGLVQTTA